MTTTLDSLRRGLADRYDLQTEIGRGGMATVYRAVDRKHGRAVAIKVLSAEFSAHVTARRFLREIEIAAKLTHPHILPLHDSGTVDDLLYYVTPFVAGASLREHLAGTSRMTADAAAQMGVEVAGALAYAHAEGVVHRDVKPANILLEEGHAVVCDFGIARAAWPHPSHTTTGIAAGTPLYMSPEQWVDEAIDGKADVYSLGCVLFEALTGKPPFAQVPVGALFRRKAVGPAPGPRSVQPDVPSPLDQLVRAMLDPAPANRPSAAQVADRLRAWLPGTQSPGMRRQRWVWPGMALATTVAATVVASVIVSKPLTPTHGLVADRVMVGLFENRTGDPELEPLGGMATDWVTQGLQLAGLGDVVPTATALSAAAFVKDSKPADPIRMLAEETRSGVVVTGTYYRLGDTLRFHVQIRDVAHDKPLPAIGPESGAIKDVGDILQHVRQRVAGTLATARDVRIGETLGKEIRPPTYEAYRSFVHATELYTRNDPRGAIPLFREAYAQDTTFLVSLLFLALNHSNLGEWAIADSILHRVDRRRTELTPYYTAWLDYRMALLSKDRGSALAAIRHAVEIAPSSKAAYNYAAEALENGRAQEAVDALTAIDAERGAMRGWLPYWWLLADALHVLGRTDDERRVAETAMQDYPDRLVPIALRARVAAAGGDVGEVLDLLRSGDRLRQEERGPSIGAAYVDSGAELWAHGFGDRATPLFEAALAWYAALPPDRAAEPDARRQRVRALCWLRRWNEAEEAARTLVAEYPGQVDNRGLPG